MDVDVGTVVERFFQHTPLENSPHFTRRYNGGLFEARDALLENGFELSAAAAAAPRLSQRKESLPRWRRERESGRDRERHAHSYNYIEPIQTRSDIVIRDDGGGGGGASHTQPRHGERERLEDYYAYAPNKYKSMPVNSRRHSEHPDSQPSFERAKASRKSILRSMGKLIKRAFTGSQSSTSKSQKQREPPPRPPLPNQLVFDGYETNGAAPTTHEERTIHDAPQQPQPARNYDVRRSHDRLYRPDIPPAADKPARRSLRRSESAGRFRETGIVRDANAASVHSLPGPSDAHSMVPLQGGIANLGNTCYINAVLQSLAASEPLTEFFMNESHHRLLQDRTHSQTVNSRLNGSDGAVTRALANLLNLLWNNKCNEPAIRDFKRVIGDFSAEYRNCQQQDAQEFLIWLLDKVHEDLNRADQRDRNYNVVRPLQSPEAALAERRKHHSSIITTLFEAQMRSSIHCKECGHKKFNYDPFMFVSLQLPQEGKRPLFVCVAGPHNALPRLTRYGINVELKGCLEDVKACICNEIKKYPDSVLLLRLNETGFSCNDSTKTIITNISSREMFAVELLETMDDQINIVFAMSVKTGNTVMRESSPFSICVSRRTGYESLCRQMFAAARCLFKAGIAEMPPLSAFRLVINDDYSLPSAIDPTLEFPLMSEGVSSTVANNRRVHPRLPSYARICVEWVGTQRVLLKNVDEPRNHKSADCLTRESVKSHTVQHCLSEFTKPEQLDWTCENCLRKNAVKQLQFRSLPQILVLHMKRFRQLRGDYSDLVKLEQSVEFPIEGLDMQPYMCPPEKNSPFTRSINRDQPSNPDDHIYDLFAVVNHKGERVTCGHYTATTRNPRDGSWRLFDDVVSRAVDPTYSAHSGYLLFYERRSDRLRRHRPTRSESVDSRMGREVRELPPRDGRKSSAAQVNGTNRPEHFRRDNPARRPTIASAAARAGLVLPLQTSKTHSILPKRETELW